MLMYLYFALKLDVRWRDDRVLSRSTLNWSAYTASFHAASKSAKTPFIVRIWKHWMICSEHMRTKPKDLYRKRLVRMHVQLHP